MQLSESGRVVLIDDNREEVQPLMESLGMFCIPYLYYDGKLDCLPENHLAGVRFVFLDIELSGIPTPDPKTKASGIVAILKKIISIKNGPYVIIFWTRHKEVIDQVIENCQSASIAPVTWLDMEKSECIGLDGKYDILHIIEVLQKKLSSFGPFQFYIEWENLISKSAKEFVYNIASCFENDDKWSEKTRFLMYRLFKTFAEHGDSFDDDEKMNAVYHLLNRGYLDQLESLTRDSRTNYFDFFDPCSLHKDFYNEHLCGDTYVSKKYIEDTEKDSVYILNPELKDTNRRKVIKKVDEIIDNEIITKDTISKMNFALFISEAVTRKDVPGTIFIIEDDSLKKDIISSAIEENVESQLCFLLLTPECDIAQKKAIIHRIVYGVILTDVEGDKLKDGEHLFHVGPFMHEGKSTFIVFNYQTISTITFKDINDHSPLISLKRDLFFDLQSKAANHINRLGNFQLGQH